MTTAETTAKRPKHWSAEEDASLEATLRATADNAVAPADIDAAARAFLSRYRAVAKDDYHTPGAVASRGRIQAQLLKLALPPGLIAAVTRLGADAPARVPEDIEPGPTGTGEAAAPPRFRAEIPSVAARLPRPPKGDAWLSAGEAAEVLKKTPQWVGINATEHGFVFTTAADRGKANVRFFLRSSVYRVAHKLAAKAAENVAHEVAHATSDVTLRALVKTWRAGNLTDAELLAALRRLPC